MEEIKAKLEKFNNELLEIGVVRQISEATNVPPMFFALGIITVSVVLVAFDFAISSVIV